MARKKVQLERIANDSCRRAAFKNRRKSLLKKVAELSTLCGIDACVIVYGRNEPHPEVWPSPHEATGVLTNLSRLPEKEQSKKMMNPEGIIRQRIGKLQKQLRKQEMENRELETMLLMYKGLEGRSMHDVEMSNLTRLAWLIELKWKETQKRLESLRTERAAAEVRRIEVAATILSEVKESLIPMASEPAMEEMELLMMMMSPRDEIMGHVPFFDHGSSAWLDAYIPNN